MSEILYGYCQCGCGAKTQIAKSKEKRRNQAKGQPRRFLPGHYARTSKTIPAEERFWAKVDKSDGDDSCWIWKAGIRKDGYGVFHPSALNRNKVAHRFAYELTYGEIPDGLLACHKCDNHKCVNPKHIFLGTQRDNMRDMLAKGRNGTKRVTGESHHKAKLSNEKISYIRNRYAVGDIKQKDLAKEFGVSQTNISCIIRRTGWRCVE
jgi:hypothetical protein